MYPLTYSYHIVITLWHQLLSLNHIFNSKMKFSLSQWHRKRGILNRPARRTRSETPLPFLHPTAEQILQRPMTLETKRARFSDIESCVIECHFKCGRWRCRSERRTARLASYLYYVSVWHHIPSHLIWTLSIWKCSSGSTATIQVPIPGFHVWKPCASVPSTLITGMALNTQLLLVR